MPVSKVRASVNDGSGRHEVCESHAHDGSAPGANMPSEGLGASSLNPPRSPESGRDDAEESAEGHDAVPREDLNERPSHRNDGPDTQQTNE